MDKIYKTKRGEKAVMWVACNDRITIDMWR